MFNPTMKCSECLTDVNQLDIKYHTADGSKIFCGPKTTTTHHWMKGQKVEVLEKELESIQEVDIDGRVTTKKGKGKLKQKILNELVRREIKPYKTHFKVVK